MPGLIESVDTKFKIIHISKTIGLAFQDLDFVVDTFNHSGGYRMIKIVQKTNTIACEGKHL